MASDCIPHQVLFNLSRALRTALPSTRILPSTLRAADGDFFSLTEADYVVVAGGSFGLLGAMAGKPGQQVRSPACDHHLDVAGSRRAPSPKPLRNGWLEYPYDLVRTRDCSSVRRSRCGGWAVRRTTLWTTPSAIPGAAALAPPRCSTSSVATEIRRGTRRALRFHTESSPGLRRGKRGNGGTRSGQGTAQRHLRRL